MNIKLILKTFFVVFIIDDNISQSIATECCDADCLDWKARI